VQKGIESYTPGFSSLREAPWTLFRTILKMSHYLSDLVSISKTGSELFLSNLSQRSRSLIIWMYLPIRALATTTYSSSQSTSPGGVDSTVAGRLVLLFQLRCN